jgi:hypothetical protein
MPFWETPIGYFFLSGMLGLPVMFTLWIAYSGTDNIKKLLIMSLFLFPFMFITTFFSIRFNRINWFKNYIITLVLSIVYSCWWLKYIVSWFWKNISDYSLLYHIIPLIYLIIFFLLLRKLSQGFFLMFTKKYGNKIWDFVFYSWWIIMLWMYYWMKIFFNIYYNWILWL